MFQRLVIRLLPLEVMMFSLSVGWAVVTLVLGGGGVAPTAPAAQRAVPAAEDAPVLVSAPLTTAILSPIFTPEVQHWVEAIVAWAGAYQLDPNLIATVMQIESCGGPGAVSRSNAQGLFQVMPFHFAEGEAMQDPDTNAKRGLTYLAQGLARANGEAGLALAGYNGGHSQIGKDAALWPNETQRYWYWGTGIYAEAVSGQAVSARLQEWLEAGGASLCTKAALALGLLAQ